MTTIRDGGDRPDAWFEYVLTAGRFSAWPIRWQGWAAMIILIAAPIAGSLALSRALPDAPRALLVLGSLALCFSTLFPLAYFKGRPAKRSGSAV